MTAADGGGPLVRGSPWAEPIKKKNDRIITLPLLYIGMLKKHSLILLQKVALSRKCYKKMDFALTFTLCTKALLFIRCILQPRCELI